MKRYRLIKWDEAYGPLELNGVYDGDFKPKNWEETIEETAKRFPDEWEDMSDLIKLANEAFECMSINNRFHYNIELKSGESITVTTGNGSTITITA